MSGLNIDEQVLSDDEDFGICDIFYPPFRKYKFTLRMGKLPPIIVETESDITPWRIRDSTSVGE